MKRFVGIAVLALVAGCGGTTVRPDPHAQRACPAPPPPCECDGGMTDQQALERLARAEEERAALEEELARRAHAQATVPVADAGTPVASGGTAQTVASVQTGAYAQVYAAIDQMTQQMQECDEAIALAVRVRAAMVPAAPAQPRLCGDAALQTALDAAAVSGSGAMVSFSSVRDHVRQHCGHFSSHATPDDRAQRQIQIYGEQVDRVERFTTEVVACEHAVGQRAQFTCTHSYGTIDATTVAEAQRAHEMVNALQRELVAARAFRAPFPCTTPTLARIHAVDTWRGEMTMAQMPGLVSGARHVCDSMDWDDTTLIESARSLSSTLDSAEASARQRKRALEQSLASMRASLP